MCSTLYCIVRRPVRTDSSAKQKSIGLLADGWGSTLSQTLSLCSRPVRHPSCEWTHCAHANPSTSTHYVRKKAKAHYQESPTQVMVVSSTNCTQLSFPLCGLAGGISGKTPSPPHNHRSSTESQWLSKHGGCSLLLLKIPFLQKAASHAER
ncbi:unnamed protein product [Pleuronectes platessa]|uniref:Uncharacterized protein n=1 Tax=Pleuronectes platessa TaxID=8262 RepID=A0A9N7ZAM9_PLEPL|nr:unnamed protein product [Pleuronectes platessa]